MKVFRLFISIIIVLAIAVTGFGCTRGGGSAGDQTIVIWEDEKNVDTVNAICDEFARFYKVNYPKAPSLKFKVIPHSERSSIEDLALDGPAGVGPDIVAFVHDTLGTAVEGNLVAKNAYSDKITAQHMDSAVKAATYKDSLYGYPITSESQVLIYKKDKISAAQAASIEAIVGNGADQANARLIWDVMEGYYGFGMFTDALLYGQDGSTTTGSKDSYLDFKKTETKSNINAVRAYRNSANLIVPGKTNGETDVEGLAKFLTSGANGADAIVVAPYFWAAAKKALGDNVAMAPLPSIGGNALMPLSGYKLYAVSKNSKQPALAHMLADFMISEEAQAMRLRDKTLLPTNEALLGKLSAAGDSDVIVDNWRGLATTRITIPNANVKEANIFSSSLSNSRTMPSLPRFSGFWVGYASNFANIWNASSLSDTQLNGSLDGMTDVL